MEVYADNLLAALNNLDQTEFAFNGYRPHPGALLKYLPEVANLSMRAARYISYPKQVNKIQSDISHIVDHGYAHLMTNLDPAKTVVTVHDIIPLLAGRGLIEGVRDKKRAHLAEWTSRFYKKAARIIAISESTRRDLVRYCGCDEGKIRVIYYGVDPAYQPYPEQTRKGLRAKFDLPINKHLVLVTGEAFYKNQQTSLKVMETLQKKYGEEINLVRLGGASSVWADLVNQSRFRNQIIQIDYLDPEKMPELYNAVDCLLFPSWYEGFGWPPVEAMACGTPAITSNVASLPEACGDAGIMFDPDDVKELANGIVKMVSDPDFRKSQIAKGIIHAKQFIWKQNAINTLAVYRELN